MQNSENVFQMDRAIESKSASSDSNDLFSEAYSGLKAFKQEGADSSPARAGLPEIHITGLDNKETAGNCKDYLDKFSKGQDLDAAEQTAKSEIDRLTAGSSLQAKYLKEEIKKWSGLVNSKDIENYGLSGKTDAELLNVLKDECSKGLSGASGLKITTILEAMRQIRQ